MMKLGANVTILQGVTIGEGAGTTAYALEAMDELPLSARLLQNAHYLMCNSERYAKKYPGEFRSSPVWIGRKGSGLNYALYVPPVYEDMINAFLILSVSSIIPMRMFL